MGNPTDDSVKRVAVVLSGAVARGAFQAGALGQVLSRLPADSQPSMILGTSAGAINAVLWSQHQDDDPAVTAASVNATWTRMSNKQVYRPVGWQGLPATLKRVILPAVEGFAGHGTGIRALLDTAPLQAVVREEFPHPLDLATGRLHTVGVVATWMPMGPGTHSASGRSVLFLQEREPSTWQGSAARALDVERTTIIPEHVLASSAVPVGFPAQPVPGPRSGWYIDGGVRLNTPIKAAIDLGATHVIVVSAMSLRYSQYVPAASHPVPPNVADASAQVMHALLGDRAVEDLLAVEKTNSILAQIPDDLALRSRTSNRRYQPVEVMAVAPEPGRLGQLADTAWRSRYGEFYRRRGLGDTAALGRLLRGAGDGQGRRELLSYVLFDEQYFADSIDHGVKRAQVALDRGWQTTEIVGPWLG